MRIVSPLLKRVVYPSLAKAGVFRRAAAGGLAVLTYHGVLPEGYKAVDPLMDGSLLPATSLRRQLRLLKANYNVITPEEMLQWCEQERELPPRAVLVTCDDGLVNAATDMLAVLQEEGVRCLFFALGLSAGDAPGMLWYDELYLMLLAAAEGPFSLPLGGLEVIGYLGTREQRRALWWELSQFLVKCDYERCSCFLETVRVKLGVDEEWKSAYMADTAARRRFSLMFPHQLQVLLSAGMTIGAHTLSHPMLSQLPEEAARFEIEEGRRRLESVLNRKIWAFAYPFGGPESVASREFVMAEQAGFKMAFLSFGGGLGSDLPRYALPRIHVTAEMTLAEFEAHVSGFHTSLQKHAGRMPPSGLQMAPG